jgi:iron(III) transport system substrate-binding protein
MLANRLPRALTALAVALVLVNAAGGPLDSPPPAAAQGGSITVYSGRAESLVGRLIDSFRESTGINVQVRYGDTAELAATLLEEGNNSPADVFFAQDAGGLGAVDERGLLRRLPDAVLNRVPSTFRAPSGNWVGASGRARVLAYNTNAMSEANLPDTVQGLTHPVWRGRVGWVPSNASFQAFITAMRVTEGDAATRTWLQEMKANGARAYASNPAAVLAVANGEVDVALVNHYYLYNIIRDRGPVPVQNYFPRAGGPGSMINVAGAGVLSASRNGEAAQRFVEYLLSPAAQQYFAASTFEYPLAAGATADPGLPALATIPHPDIDLNRLRDLASTLRMLQDVGVL